MKVGNDEEEENLYARGECLFEISRKTTLLNTWMAPSVKKQ